MKYEKVFGLAKNLFSIEERLNELKTKKLDLRNQISSIVVGADVPSKNTKERKRRPQRRKAILKTLKASSQPLRAYEIAEKIGVSGREEKNRLSVCLNRMAKKDEIHAVRHQSGNKAWNVYSLDA